MSIVNFALDTLALILMIIVLMEAIYWWMIPFRLPDLVIVYCKKQVEFLIKEYKIMLKL
jgi:hypothetical protein